MRANAWGFRQGYGYWMQLSHQGWDANVGGLSDEDLDELEKVVKDLRKIQARV